MNSVKKIVLVLTTLGLISLLNAQLGKENAKELVLNDLLKNMIGTVDVYLSQHAVECKNKLMLYNGKTLSNPFSQSWVFFVDDMPFAMWAHPCRYIFVNTYDGKYRIIRQSFHPLNMKKHFVKISGVTISRNNNSVQGNIPACQGVTLQKPAPNPHLFAVIIGNGEDFMIWNSISMMYTTMTEKGYSKNNIFVHFGYAQDLLPPNGDLDGDSIVDDIDYLASKELIELTFKNLSGLSNSSNNEIPVLGPDDTLFIYVCTHGYYDSHGHYLVLGGGSLIPEKLYDYQLTSWLKDINCGQMIILLQPCYSGGFLDNLSPYGINSVPFKCENRIIHTATDSTHVAWAEGHITPYLFGTELKARFTEFTFYWCAAWRGFYPDFDEPWKINPEWQVGTFPFADYRFQGFNDGCCGTDIQCEIPHPADYHPDINHDGTIGLGEIFSYANNFDTWSPNGFYLKFSLANTQYQDERPRRNYHVIRK